MLSSRENGNTLSEVKVCGCCLGSNSSDANEIVECDGCGISVHEVSLTNALMSRRQGRNKTQINIFYNK